MNALNFNIKYGLLAGTLLIIVKYIILVSFEDVDELAVYIDYAGLIALAACAYLAVVEKRNQFNQGLITFGESFMICMYVTLIAAIMVAGFLYVYAAYIDPYRADRMVAETEKFMRNKKYKEEDIQKAIANARVYYKPMTQMVMGITVMLYGLFISLVVSAFTKRTKRN
jgi:hypothetical protein